MILHNGYHQVTTATRLDARCSCGWKTPFYGLDAGPQAFAHVRHAVRRHLSTVAPGQPAPDWCADSQTTDADRRRHARYVQRVLNAPHATGRALASGFHGLIS